MATPYTPSGTHDTISRIARRKLKAYISLSSIIHKIAFPCLTIVKELALGKNNYENNLMVFSWMVF